MKPQITFFNLFCLLTLMLIAPFGKACDRSQISLDSVVFNTTYDIYIEMRVGGGVTGFAQGAGNETGTFAYAFYGSPALAPLSFPTSITSDTTRATYPGFNAGPAFGSVFAIGYLSQGQPYTCINSTALCGNVHTDTKKLLFRLNMLPDSIRLFGVEGDGNPYAGCYPDIDMLIDFSILPVEWGSFTAEANEQEVSLEWTTLVETNSSSFEIERSTDGETYANIGWVAAQGNSDDLSRYQFIDQSPVPGTNYYRLKQVDLNGKHNYSEVAQIQVEAPTGLTWSNAGPNPVQEAVRMNVTSPRHQTAQVSIWNLHGQRLAQSEETLQTGNNRLDMATGSLPRGTYLLQLNSPTGKLTHTFLKL